MNKKAGDELIARMKWAQLKQLERDSLRIILALLPKCEVSIAYVTIFASEGVSTRDMTRNYEFRLGPYFISKDNYNAGRN